MNYRILSWDSKFFLYPVSQLEYNDTLLHAREEIFQKLKDDSTHLLQIVISDVEHYGQDYIDRARIFITKELGANLVDEKVTFSMPLDPNDDHGHVEHVSEFSGTAVDQLYELAYVSGEYSRYNLDTKFQHDEFRRLYRAWIDNALKNVETERVFVYRESDTIKGMVTLKVPTPHCVIGLFAVHPQWQGKSVGSKLIKFAGNYSLTYDCSGIRVTTQRKNSGAIRFYEKQGFKLESTKLIYHLWMD